MVGDIAPTAEAGRHVTQRVLSEVEQSHGHASFYLWETNMTTVSVVGVIAEACDLRKWPISMRRVMKRDAVSRVIRACRIFKDQV